MGDRVQVVEGDDKYKGMVGVIQVITDDDDDCYVYVRSDDDSNTHVFLRDELKVVQKRRRR